MNNLAMRRKQNELDEGLQGQAIKALGPTLGEVYGQFLGIPGLRGFWPMSTTDEYGNALDMSVQGRVMYYNGNPAYAIDNTFVPYIQFDGTDDYLHRPPEFGLQITGLEAYYASAARGLTVGGWFWTDDTPGTTEGHVTHQEGTNALSHFDLYTDASLNSVFRIYNGASNIDATLAAGLPVAKWNWQVGRFTPGSEVAVFTNRTKTTAATAFASLNTSKENFVIGAYRAGSFPMDGRAAMVFLSANVLSDEYINMLYYRSRVLLGV